MRQERSARTLALIKHSDIILAARSTAARDATATTICKTSSGENRRVPELWMMRIKKAMITAVVSVAVAATIPIVPGSAGSARTAIEAGPISASVTTPDPQSGCPLIFPDGPVAVAPNQPAVQDQSTIGIINALCDVTLDFVGWGFTPTSVALGWD